jgi:hypothetical protein
MSGTLKWLSLLNRLEDSFLPLVILFVLNIHRCPEHPQMRHEIVTDIRLKREYSFPVDLITFIIVTF